MSAFVEKPTLEKAQQYLASGDYFWNAGIFVATPETVLKEIEETLPMLYRGLVRVREVAGKDEFPKVLKDVYEEVESISFDYGVMERTRNPVFVVPSDCGWSDVGSRQSLYEMRETDRDAEGNLAEGECLLIDCKENFVLEHRRSHGRVPWPQEPPRHRHAGCDPHCQPEPGSGGAHGDRASQEKGEGGDTVNQTIFREYDIRGRVPDDLNEATVYELGLAIGTYYQNHGAQKVTLGRDCRFSSPSLRDTLLKGLIESGMHVTDIGMVPTPLLYFSLFHLDVQGGIQITGSHNPPEFNGFKVCLNKTTIFGREIQEIRRLWNQGALSGARGRFEEKDVTAPYLENILKGIRKVPGQKKVVVDAGNGVGGLVAPQVYGTMGVDVGTSSASRMGDSLTIILTPQYLKTLFTLKDLWMKRC